MPSSSCSVYIRSFAWSSMPSMQGGCPCSAKKMYQTQCPSGSPLLSRYHQVNLNQKGALIREGWTNMTSACEKQRIAGLSMVSTSAVLLPSNLSRLSLTSLGSNPTTSSPLRVRVLLHEHCVERLTSCCPPKSAFQTTLGGEQTPEIPSPKPKLPTPVRWKKQDHRACSSFQPSNI